MLVVCGRAEGSWHGVEVGDEGMETNGIHPFRCRGRVGRRVGPEGSSSSGSMRVGEAKQCQDREMSGCEWGMQPQHRRDYTHRWETDLTKLEEDRVHKRSPHLPMVNSLTTLGRA